VAEGEDRADGRGGRLNATATAVARTAPRQRLELIDALRAFALVGILQVNIQSFVWGAGDPLGYFAVQPSTAEYLTVLLVGTFVSAKFISIFAFLFGVSAALQLRRIRSRAIEPDNVRSIYRRRLWFLFATGIAHGVLLYHGDILSAYALCGFVLLHYAGQRASPLWRSVRLWWIIAAIVLVGWTVLLESVSRLFPVAAPGDLPDESLERLSIYTQEAYWSQLATRAADYLNVVVSTLTASAPWIVALFLMGYLAGRLGWFSRPWRHAHVWRIATWIGICALPIAVAGAWLNAQAMLQAPSDPSLAGYTLQLFGSPLACLYVAAFVRLRERPPVARLIRWLAPAGRMPLTNYLAQSMLMGLLLSGWGVGLGAWLDKVQLAFVALVIVFAQIVISRWWIARYRQGPFEALWRRATYG